MELYKNIEDKVLRVGVVFIMMLTTIDTVELRWMKSEVWIFYGIPGFLLLGFAIMIFRKQRFNFTLTDAIAAMWFLYYVGRVWIGNEWSCRTEFLRTTETFLLYVGLRIAFDRTKMSVWMLIGVILAFGCYEAWLGVSQMYGDGISRHRLFALTGNFLNPGPYSAYLMFGVAIGLAALKDMSNRAFITGIADVSVLNKIKDKLPVKAIECLKAITWKHFVVTAIIVMAMMIPATLSRAAFLGVAVVALLIYRDKYWRYRYFVWGAIALMGFAFYFFKQGSADGRLIIWKASLTTWIDYPWLGVGIGGFFHALAEGIAKLSTTNTDLSSAGVADYSFNILLKIVTEQGIVGGILAISLTTGAMMTLYRNNSSLFWGMVSLLVFAMFSYPFDLLPYKVIAVLIISWSESIGGKRVLEIGRIKVFLLSCLFSFVSWQAGNISGVCYQTEWDSYMPLAFNSFSIEDGYKWQLSANDYSHLLCVFGKKLHEAGRYNDSNAIFYQATRCSADPVFYVLMGNNYKYMRCYDLAEKSYYKAFAIMPNRLYPLYQLVLLYKESGDMEKARVMARRVIDMKPKVDSRLTRNIKEKARDFLREH